MENKVIESWDTIEECVCNLLKGIREVIDSTEIILKYSMEIFTPLKNKYYSEGKVEDKEIGEVKFSTLTKENKFNEYRFRVYVLRANGEEQVRYYIKGNNNVKL